MQNQSRLEEFWRIVESYEGNGTNFSDIPKSALPYPMESVLWKSLDPLGYAKVFACLVIIIGGFLENVGIILTVALTKALRTALNTCMVNLAVADAMICIFCVVPYAINVMTYNVYILGEFMCKFNAFIQMTCLISSVLTLSVISCDFFKSSLDPFQVITEKRRNSLIITGIWLVSMLVSVPLLIVKEYTTIQWRDFNETRCFEYWPVEAYYDKSTGDTIKHMPLRVAYFLTICVTLFFVPVMMIITLNSWVVCRFWTENSVDGNEERHLERNRKTTVRFLIISVAFIICWTPTQVVIFYDLCRGNPTEPMPVWFPEFYWFAYYIAYANSIMNPTIYSFYNKPLQIAFLKLVRCAIQGGRLKKSVYSRVAYTTSLMSNVSRRLSRTLSSRITPSSRKSTTDGEIGETADNISIPVRNDSCDSDERKRVESI